ncbi:MAG: acetyl-CoA C-acyltransferase [Bdellovibrionaceae bacterium]|jgi:acetyl-CoA C-acetyltransferase|nr:acetyl-CoA C-acyltransferase [Pseudobdellovibrionaceae bacterium]
MKKRVAIVDGLRIPFVKSQGAYKGVTNQEMMTAVLEGLVQRWNLQGQVLGDVIGGTVMKRAENWNLVREAVLGTSLHPNTSGLTIQKACATSLEAANLIALKIRAGQIQHGVALGSDTNSESDQLPMVVEARTGLSMGQHAERMAQRYGISRADQDRWAYESHQKAAKAYDQGFFAKQLMEFHGVQRDGILRPETSLEKLASLKTVFDTSPKGSLTAGNSTALTDGAAAVFLAEAEWAQAQGYPILARFVDAEVAALDFVRAEHQLLMAPTLAVSRLLKRHGLKLQDFDFYEIHEAFAAQVLATLKAWESSEFCEQILGLNDPLGAIDHAKINVYGGSLSLGHPFAATGARLVTTAARLLAARGGGRVLISVCAAGGMGVAAIVEA